MAFTAAEHDESSVTEPAASPRTDVEKALLGGTTYRSLGEQRLSPAEERFEKGRGLGDHPVGSGPVR